MPKTSFNGCICGPESHKEIMMMFIRTSQIVSLMSIEEDPIGSFSTIKKKEENLNHQCVHVFHMLELEMVDELDLNFTCAPDYNMQTTRWLQ